MAGGQRGAQPPPLEHELAGKRSFRLSRGPSTTASSEKHQINIFLGSDKGLLK